MGRDHKLSLIIGFVVLLVVGMLISDHVSRDQRGSGRHVATIDGDGNGPVRNVGLQLGPAPAIRLDEEVAPLPVPDAEQATHDDASQQADPFGLIRDTASKASRDFSDLFKPAVPPEGDALRPIERPSTPAGPREITTEKPPESSGSERGPSTAPTTRVAYHTVAKGESLFAITNRYYGNGNLWRELAKVNPNRVSPDGAVDLGVKLVLPDSISGTQRREAGDAPKQEPVAPAPPKSSPPQQRPPATRVASRDYTVKPNDTLGHISQRMLGTVKRQSELLAMNSDQIKNPDDIRAGMVLKIPTNE